MGLQDDLNAALEHAERAAFPEGMPREVKYGSEAWLVYTEFRLGAALDCLRKITEQLDRGRALGSGNGHN